MTSGIGQNVVDSLGKKDLNKDGNIINLAIVGSSRFYDFEIFEELIEVASGKKTKSEINEYGDDEFNPWVIGATM